MRNMVQQRSQETRERVLEAATTLVLERGHENVAMKDLVEASGVSNGSIFHHFGSKDGVLEEIFLAERRDYLGYVAQRILAHEGDPCDALGEGARGVILFQARDPERHFRLATQFVHSDFATRHTANSQELSAELERPVMEWAIPHLAAGRLPMMQPVTIQSFMLGSAELICNQWRYGRITGPLEDQAALTAEFVASGLKQIREKYRPAETA